MSKFKEIGDIIVQYDPGHAALPWAGFRFLLMVMIDRNRSPSVLHPLTCSQLAVDDGEKMGSILVAMERIAVVIDRCAIYEKIYFGQNLQLTQGLEKALVLLYAAVLTYVAWAIRFFTQNTAGRLSC